MRIHNFAFAALATSAAAVPHLRHAHPHPVRRDADVVTTYIMETDKAVLYVDQNGNPVATSLLPVDAAAADPTPTPSLEESSSEAPATSPPQTTEALPPSSELAPGADTSASAPSGYDNDEDEDGEVIGYTISYSPYNADHSCKTEAEVDADIDGIGKYSMVRIYGTDCGQVPLVMAAAKRNNLRVFAGIWDPADAAAEAQLLIDGAKDDWSRIHSVVVGNEVLTNGMALDTLMGGISTARSMLQGAGYVGPITTVEVYSKLWEDQYKPLCRVIDYVAANCHPYFNALQTPENAGTFVRAEANDLRSKFCNMDVVITESGWPTAGQTNGMAVPGLENQRIAIKALSKEFSGDKDALVLFSAYDDPWKNDNEYGVEHYWGIHGGAPSVR